MMELDFQFLARPEPSAIISGFSEAGEVFLAISDISDYWEKLIHLVGLRRSLVSYPLSLITLVNLAANDAGFLS